LKTDQLSKKTLIQTKAHKFRLPIDANTNQDIYIHGNKLARTETNKILQ